MSTTTTYQPIITLEELERHLAETEGRKSQMLADLNATLGEISVLKKLITQAQKQPEPEAIQQDHGQ